MKRKTKKIENWDKGWEEDFSRFCKGSEEAMQWQAEEMMRKEEQDDKFLG